MSSIIKVDTIQDQDGNNIINENSNTITIGASGDTVALASGASQTGFGRTGTVDWETTPQTGSFQATSGKGYFMNTTSGALTLTTPGSPSAGDIFSAADYAATWDSNALTISPHSGAKIGGVSADVVLDTKGQSVTFVYVDSTQGWLNVQDSTSNERASFIEATGGTITCSGNDRIHTFTGPGTFTVTKVATSCAPTNNLVSYMVVAGGGGGGGTGPSHVGGGGGAGGVRETKSPVTPYTASPLDGYPTPGNRIIITAQAYPITVGGGGTAGGEPDHGGNGNTSTFSTISSAGGGGGGSIASPGNDPGRDGQPGGSGGGGSSQTAGSGGTGNTPPVTPAQGTNGATGVDAPPDFRGGGGGGATAAGTAGANPGPAPAYVQGAGGAGATSCISGSPVVRGGGGGSGGSYATPNPGLPGAGGAGGGGAGGSAPGVSSRLGVAGTANTGGGGGGAAGGNPGTGEGSARCGGAGGSGVVIIRYKAR